DGGDAARAELHAATRQRLAAAVLDVAAATGAAPFHGGSPRPGAGAMVTAVAAAGSMAPAQGLEQGLAGAAVGFPAQALLFQADGGAAAFAQQAVNLADVVAAGDQQGLQLAPLRPRQAGIVGGPGGVQAFAAAHAVGEQGDGQGVTLGSVVAEDRVVVAEDQEGRPLRTCRKQQRRLAIVPGPLAAIGAAQAAAGPVRQRAP